MASGVRINDECAKAFTAVKLGREHRYVIYALSDNLQEIVVLKKSDKDATYDDLVADLNEAEKNNECRFAIFDAEYQKNDQTLNKLVFMSWSPDSAKVKQKMVYAASKDALKRNLGQGLGKEVQANDHGDLSWDNILEIITRTDRH